MQARKSNECTYHIYIASALMEWTQNNDLNVARKVFEIGLKKYITEPKVKSNQKYICLTKIVCN